MTLDMYILKWKTLISLLAIKYSKRINWRVSFQANLTLDHQLLKSGHLIWKIKL